VRVVSLVPSITESLLEWGVRPVAVTRFCEAPGIATVGGTKNPDLDAIVALHPDLVLMDKEENRQADAGSLEQAGVKVHATHVRAVDDVEPTLRSLAAALGLTHAGTTRDLAPATTAALSVWVPIWRRPWMTISGATYGSSVLAAAGFDNACRDFPDPYPLHDPEAAAALKPDLVLAPSEPYPFSERHRRQLERVAPVVFVDGRDLFWWGTRTSAAIGRLRSLARDLASAQG
jgi:ABC-type Fe3+-hydroxamate transport system substrate-binding protein